MNVCLMNVGLFYRVGGTLLSWVGAGRPGGGCLALTQPPLLRRSAFPHRAGNSRAAQLEGLPVDHSGLGLVALDAAVGKSSTRSGAGDGSGATLLVRFSRLYRRLVPVEARRNRCAVQGVSSVGQFEATGGGRQSGDSSFAIPTIAIM